jgi:hypothetical protein
MIRRMCLAFAFVYLAATPVFAAGENDYAHIELKGVLHSGDLNRLTVDANGHIYRLDIAGSQNLSNFAARHDLQPVIVDGSLVIENDSRGHVSHMFVDVSHIETALTANVSYQQNNGDSADREVAPPPPAVAPAPAPIREREVIIEKHREPWVKVGPLRIGN